MTKGACMTATKGMRTMTKGACMTATMGMRMMTNNVMHDDDWGCQVRGHACQDWVVFLLSAESVWRTRVFDD